MMSTQFPKQGYKVAVVSKHYTLSREVHIVFLINVLCYNY